MQYILQIDGNMDIVADVSHYEQINENVYNLLFIIYMISDII